MHTNAGFTLIELIAFIVIISVGLTGMLSTFNQTTISSVDPLIKIRALELAQSQLDEILALKYDHCTPTGGVPACTSSSSSCSDNPPKCAGIDSADAAGYNDVDDYNGYTDPSPPYANYSISATVSFAGTDLGLPLSDAKLITVVVTPPDGSNISLSSYKANF